MSKNSFWQPLAWKSRRGRPPITTTILWISLLFIGLPLLAQTPYQVTIPGSAFHPVGSGVTVQDMAGGRSFRGKSFAKIILRATLPIPPPSSAEAKMQRLIIRFRTRTSGPSLRIVELRNGTNVSFKMDMGTGIRGDYTTREILEPENRANAWAWRDPIGVSAQSVLRLEVQCPGGFDSSINPRDLEFILTAVEVRFPAKASNITQQSIGQIKKLDRSQLDRSIGSRVRPSALTAESQGIIYAVSSNKELIWYNHTGHDNGNATWATGVGKKVGSGWDFKHVFPGSNGVVYAISPNGDLWWYQHTGRSTGGATWATPEGKKVGSGWNFKQVFSDGDGVIYAVSSNGDLWWYQHTGYKDGRATWTTPEGKQVGSGWNFKQVFSGGNGVIYAVSSNGDLWWYRHTGRSNGGATWATAEGKQVGSGWNFKQVFSGGEGVIYAISPNGDLWWYQHTGYKDGQATWATPEGKKVGSGWNFPRVFSY